MRTDTLTWRPVAVAKHYHPDHVAAIQSILGYEPKGADLRRLELEGSHSPDEVFVAEGNLLTTAGLNRLTNLIIGGGGAAFTNAQAIVGVGSSSTAATVADTVLGGNGSTTTAYYQGADASNPTQSNGLITCNATFASGNANFSWNEWCWAIATGALTPGGTLASVGTSPQILNHKVQSMGSKVVGGVSTLNATITLS